MRYHHPVPPNNYDRNGVRPPNNNRPNAPRQNTTMYNYRKKTGASNKRLSHLQSPSRRWNNRNLRVETVGKPNDSFEKRTGQTSKGPRCESPESTSSHKEASAYTSRTNSTYNHHSKAVEQSYNGKGQTAIKRKGNPQKDKQEIPRDGFRIGRQPLRLFQ
jgi:hypothetical protein